MARVSHSWAELERAIHGELILPDAKGYDRIRKPFIARFDDIRPQAVVRCAEVSDVVAVLGFAARQGIHVAVRSGGHSLAGLSSTTGILIDVSPMNSVRVGDGMALIGAGARLGEVYERLLAHDATLPAGTCPSVGVAGLTLAGGFGLLGRMYGLTLDRLVQMTVVLADGRIVECDEENDRDLFWAMRGAGAGNLGVATALRFRTVPAPSKVTIFDLAWPYAHDAPLLQAWQCWAPAAPDELCAELQLSASADPEEPPVVHLQGAAMASKLETRQWLGELLSGAGVEPSSELCREGSYREAVDFHGAESTSAPLMEDTPDGPVIRQGYRSTKSEFFDQRIPNAGNISLLENLSQHRRRGEVRSLYLVPWGGAYNRPPADATAFAHRSQLFLIEHSAFVDPTASESETAAADEWVRRSWGSVHRCGSGRVYPGFPDLGLGDWASAYFADNLPRLLRAKATYDPDGVFNTQQPLIPT